MARRRKTAKRSGNRAIGYLRVSTLEQAESGLGLAAQEERVRGYATARGLNLVDLVRDEGVRGSVVTSASSFPVVGKTKHLRPPQGTATSPPGAS